jgi:uncharacterized repeat protein (TIGR02543 family)
MQKEHAPFHIVMFGLMLAAVLVFGLGQPAVKADLGVLPETVVERGQYYTKSIVTAADGTQIGKISISGPSTPPAGFVRSSYAIPEPVDEAYVKTLTVPAFDWHLGCSAVAGSMIAAYWDRNGFDNMYTGPTDGGVMPLDNSSWGTFTDIIGDTYGQCPLTGSREGLDGRFYPGTFDDYWVSYLSGIVDPFITNGWTEHEWGTAIGDYMKTSQYNYYNDDGSTSFYYYDDGTALPCEDMEYYEIQDYDGAYGRKLFYEARGYSVSDCYTQGTNNIWPEYGFTFAQYKAEIDAARPVMIHVEGHTMVGVGYDDLTQTVYLHDTWDYGTWSMPWGGEYYGMLMWGVSIVNPYQEFTLTTAKTGTGGGTIVSSPVGISCGADCSEVYAADTMVRLTATAKPGSTFAGWNGACGGTAKSCFVNMIKNRNVTAKFLVTPPGTYYLGVQKLGNGTGTVTSLNRSGIACGTDCYEFYPSGTLVRMRAKPDTGSIFTGWSGPCGGTGDCWVTMSAAKYLKASFTLQNPE